MRASAACSWSAQSQRYEWNTWPVRHSESTRTRTGSPLATCPIVISQMTPTGASPAMRQRSTAASVCPARTSTPPSRARSGKMCPGFTRSEAAVPGSASSRIVRARSAALIPVLTPSRASTLTVNAVPRRASLRVTIWGRSRASRRSAVIGTQTTPLAYLRMNATSSGSQSSAAMVRSPSFSRSSSSTTTTIRPSLISWVASSIVANGARGATTLGRGRRAARLMVIDSSLVSPSALREQAPHVLCEDIGLQVHEVPGPESAEGGALRRVRYERDLEIGLAQRHDRERHAVDGDEPFGHEVGRESSGQREAQPRRPAALVVAREQLRGLVDVPLHEMPAERGRWRRCPLEVHAGPAHHAAKRCLRQGLAHEIDREGVVVALDHGEARPRDGDARVDGEILDDARGCDLHTHAGRARGGVAHSADLLDDSREHERVRGATPPRTPRRSARPPWPDRRRACAAARRGGPPRTGLSRARAVRRLPRAAKGAAGAGRRGARARASRRPGVRPRRGWC